MQREFDDALYNYAVDVSEAIDISLSGDLSLVPPKIERGKIFPFPLGTALIQVRHISGAILTQLGNFGDFDPPYKEDFSILNKGGEDAIYRTITDTESIPQAEANRYRLIQFTLDNSNQPQLILQIAVPMTLLDAQFESRRKVIDYGLPGVLLLAMLFGYFLAARALAPVNAIIHVARNIDVQDLSARLDVPKSKDEIAQLAITLNEMFSRIEKAFQSQERFVADASHQLLTPLTIMKNELDQMKKSSSVTNFTPMMESLNSEVEHLTRIVKDMLLLARIDSGQGVLNLQDVNLGDLTLEALSVVEKWARSKKLVLKFDIFDGDFEKKNVRGDHDLLLNLVIILLENAIKYSPESAIINVTLTCKSDVVQLSVEDRGPGIPENELPFIFERFRRGSQVDAQIKGYGLGLAIATKICQLHNARIWAENHSSFPGASFYIEIKNI